MLNIAPDLAAKRDILHNTIDLARALGVGDAQGRAARGDGRGEPPRCPSTGDAAALRAMAAQGLFGSATRRRPADRRQRAVGGVRARQPATNPRSPVRPDVLHRSRRWKPAALVLRTLTGLTGALAAGLVLGADVPIVAPARTESMETRVASCVLASLLAAFLAQARREEARAAAPPDAAAAVAQALA